MVIIACPICKKGKLKIFAKDGFDVSLDLEKANQKILCPNCLRKIQYSIYRRIEKT